MIRLYLLVLLLLEGTVGALTAYMYHGEPHDVWEEKEIPPFQELLLSWNGKRPHKGNYVFYVSVLTENWSPWLPYARWGSSGQNSFSGVVYSDVKIDQDTITILSGKQGKGFRVRVVAEEEAGLQQLCALHMCTTDYDTTPPFKDTYDSVSLPVGGLSQKMLVHERAASSFCSPTSTTAVVRYLSGKKIEPVIFAEGVWDGSADIYGNWVFNVAQAYCELGEPWRCWVKRCAHFEEVLQSLNKGNPVVASVKGPLAGGAAHYKEGHLLVVKGYDPEMQTVQCMDPAFPSNTQTDVSYPIDDFLTGWKRRGNVIYAFERDIDSKKNMTESHLFSVD